MNKEGVSNAVGVVLVVFLVIVCAFLLWAFVLSYLDGSMFEEKPDIRIVSSEGYTVYDEETELASVQIQRGDDDFDVRKVDVSFVVEGGSVDYVIDESNQGVLGSNSVRTYKFDLSGYGRPTLVRVAGVYK